MKSSTAKSPVQPDEIALGAVTTEDLELDRELKKMAAEREMAEATLSYDENKAPSVIAAPEKMDSPELRDFVDDYKPANSHASLEEQLFLARAHKCDTIEAEDVVFRAIFGYVPDTAYCMVKNVKVYRVGMVEEGRKRDARSADAGLFGLTK